MNISRRELLRAGVGATAASAALPAQEFVRDEGQSGSKLPPAFDGIRPLGDRVRPVTAQEFQGRIEKAQRLMTQTKPDFAALYLTPGTSLAYFSGIRWDLSERLMALVVPRSGDPLAVCPGFEEGRLREKLQWPIEVRVWQEDESPYGVIAKWLAERGIRTGRVAVEETTRYVFFDGLRQAASNLEFVSGDPITHACRARKSDHELELMRLACSATFDVYKATFASLREGITQRQVATMMAQGFSKMGLTGYGLVLFGPAAALPHGTREEQTLKEGEGVLIDGGCEVEGYQSDVTRTSSLGKASDKLQRAFETVRKAQDAALAAAIAGHECGTVDDAARAVVTQAGFGPGYKYFTHRLGHGLGMDGHEYPYLVRGSHILLEAAMTFSDEPGIYVPGDYGLRCEDDMVIQESGGAQLLTPYFQQSLDQPI
jgi:Xaa-Pro dipeptidase